MELILKENIENLGFKGDIVNVKSGYGRNFLIPKGKAILATSSSKKILQENIKQQEFKDKKVIDEFNEFAKTLKKLKIKISSKVSESDKLFGSITSKDISVALEAKGHKIESSLITLPGKNIKRLGSYEATIRLHREVSVQIPFDVISEKKTEKKAKDKTENKVEDKAKKKAEDKIENKVEDKAKKKAEDKTENKVEDKAKKKAEDKTENKAKKK